MEPKPLEKLFEARRERWLVEWRELLRFASVSADPARAADCRACAGWLERHLRGIGLRTEQVETAGHPLVLASREGAPGCPVVLFYGHYDVQPPDPLDQWTSPPFEPTWAGERLRARGAQDNKGQFFSALKGLEALLQLDALRCGIRIVIEGDEESGGLMALDALRGMRERVRADVLMAADTLCAPSGAPAITLGLRGIVHLTCQLRGPKNDLHSGVHGGAAPNPATGMARLLATLHDEDGRVAVAGFYDGFKEPSEQERRLANAVPFDPMEYAKLTGVPPLGGERGLSVSERVGFRPCLDINGVHSGYGGPGSKTIIPASAVAKLSARLAAGQNPERVLDVLVRHLQAHVPAGLRLEITERGIGGPALRVDPSSRYVALARQALDELFGGPTVFLWEGASVPILSALPALVGAEPVLVGFGREEDRIHAPDESYSIEQFRQGFLYTAMFLNRLGTLRV